MTSRKSTEAVKRHYANAKAGNKAVRGYIPADRVPDFEKMVKEAARNVRKAKEQKSGS